MSAEILITISRICYITAALSLLASILIWYKAGIPRVLDELKGNKEEPGRRRDDPGRKSEGKTEVLSDDPEMIMIEDIVITYCVSTLIQ